MGNVPRDHDYFPFRKAPALVNRIHDQLGDSDYIVVLGGGRGPLAVELIQLGREVRNTDIAAIRTPHVPTMQLDMELPFDRRKIEAHGRHLGIVLALSFGYVDREMAADNIQRVLLPHERCVIVEHTRDSVVVQEMGIKAARICALARELLPAVVNGDRQRAMIIEKEFLHLYPKTRGLPMMEHTDVPHVLQTLMRHSMEVGVAHDFTIALLRGNLVLGGFDRSENLNKLKEVCDKIIKWEPLHTTLREQATNDPAEIARFFEPEMRLVGSARFDSGHVMVVSLMKV